MNHNEMVKMVSEMTGATMSRSAAIIDAALRVMGAELRVNGEVNIKGIGKLKKVVRPARMGRNPRTGVDVPIPARSGVRFKASKNLVL